MGLINKFKIGDKVRVYGWDEPGVIEKITSNFIRVNGVVKSIKDLYSLDRPYFCRQAVVPTYSKMVDFFSDLPDEIELDHLSLNLSFSDEVLEDKLSGFNDFDPMNFEFEDEEGYVNSGGLLAFINYLKKNKKERPDDIVIFTDEDEYKNFLFFDFLVTDKIAKGRISGSYVSEPIFEGEGFEPIQQKIESWFNSNPKLHEHMKNGARYRKSLLTPERPRKLADDKTYTELELVDKLLIKCLDLWPELGLYIKPSDTVSALLYNSPGDKELVRRLDILTDLIVTEGANQVIPNIEDIVTD